MDMLERAKQCFDAAHEIEFETNLRLAQAAATIALVEEMREANRPRFVQIGSKAFDPAQIESVDNQSDQYIMLVSVHFRAGTVYHFSGSQCNLFLHWWNANADVVRLDAEPSNGPDWDTAKEAQ